RLENDAIALSPDRNRRFVQRILVAVQIADEGVDAAFVAHFNQFRFYTAQIGERYFQAGIEEGKLAQTVLQLGEIEFGHAEDHRRRREGYLGAAAAVRLAYNLQVGFRLAV